MCRGAGERGDCPCEDCEFSGDVEAVEVIGWVGFLVLFWCDESREIVSTHDTLPCTPFRVRR